MSAPRLIEVALPLEAINAACAREKSIRHGHPSTLHLWWARRPLAAARAVLFASLVPDPDHPDCPADFHDACMNLDGSGHNSQARDSARMRLFDFIEHLVKWESTTNEALLNEARKLIRIATDGNPPPLVDPFAGGGSIPLEAQRLGLEAHANDLNPVAALINKAMIEIPPRFAGMPPVNPEARKRMFSANRADAQTDWKGAAGLAADVRYYGAWMRERALERIGHLYPQHCGETVIAWLWARTVPSPDPALRCQVPLVNSFALSKKKGRERQVIPHVEPLDASDDGPTHRIRFTVAPGLPPKERDGTMVRRRGARCLVSGQAISYEYIKEQGNSGHMGEMLLAIVTEGKHGRNYHAPDERHERIARSAEKCDYWKPAGKIPVKHRNFQTPAYGMTEWSDLFTPRQLTALTTFSDLVAEAREQVYADALAAGLPDEPVAALLSESPPQIMAYANALATYLALSVSNATKQTSSFSIWDRSGESILQVFGRQAIPMVWDFAESNPLSNSTGSWLSQTRRVSNAVKAILAGPPGFAMQQVASAMLVTMREQ